MQLALLTVRQFRAVDFDAAGETELSELAPLSQPA